MIGARPGASAICEALYAARVTLRLGPGAAGGDTTLVANPATLVTPALLELLRAYKPELVGALRRAKAGRFGGDLAGCPTCGAEFVTVPNEAGCPWCVAADVAGARPFILNRTLAGQLGQLQDS